MERTEFWQGTAARAASLYERLEEPGLSRELEGGPARMEGLLARWCDAAALGNWELLDRRLAWDGLRRDQTGRRLGEAAAMESPRWAATLQAILARPGGTADPVLAAEAAAVPFSHLLLPFVEHAAAALDERIADRRGLVTDQGLRPALLHLLRFLSNPAAPALFERFEGFRAARESQIDRLLRRAETEAEAPPAGDRIYRAFVAEGRNGGLADLLARKSVLARQLATVVEDWVDATAERPGAAGTGPRGHRLALRRRRPHGTPGRAPPGPLRPPSPRPYGDGAPLRERPRIDL